MGIFGRKKEKTPGSTSEGSDKRELSLNLSDLNFIGIVNLPQEIKDRVKNAENMLKSNALKVCGVAPGSDEFKEIVKLQTLVSSDPETAELISQAKRKYSCVYGLKVNMSFTRREIEEIIESSKSVCGSWANEVRRKLSDAI
jgi:uncharacterized linocin/CFP29 family protein